MSYIKGMEAEEIAKLYLIHQGLTWIQSRYRTRWGEIDLIMHDIHHIVFVEVRWRRHLSFGLAHESITPLKQRKLKSTALHYLSYRRLHDKVSVRFDVVSLQGGKPHIEWIKNAF